MRQPPSLPDSIGKTTSASANIFGTSSRPSVNSDPFTTSKAETKLLEEDRRMLRHHNGKELRRMYKHFGFHHTSLEKCRSLTKKWLRSQKEAIMLSAGEVVDVFDEDLISSESDEMSL